MDIMVDTSGPGAASLLQISDPVNNADDGDLFWQGNNFGQGTGGYNGTGAFTAGAWHRIAAAYNEAAATPVVPSAPVTASVPAPPQDGALPSPALPFDSPAEAYARARLQQMVDAGLFSAVPM